MTDIQVREEAAAIKAPDKMLQVWKMAEGLSRSELVPKHFQRKPENVFLALQIADRLEVDSFAVMSNLYVVHGTPAFSAKFLIGLTNERGPFRGGLRFKTLRGDEVPGGLGVQCWAIHRETGEALEPVTVTMAQAQQAGWVKNAKYREIPEQMLSYRAATFFIRLNCPGVTLGHRTVDEVQDIRASEGPRQVEHDRPAIDASTDPLGAALIEEEAAEPPTEPVPDQAPNPQPSGEYDPGPDSDAEREAAREWNEDETTPND